MVTSGEVGASLEGLRRAAGMSVQQVAASGISPVTYSLVERGQFAGEVPTANLLRLAVLFVVTEAEIRAALAVSRDEGWHQ